MEFDSNDETSNADFEGYEEWYFLERIESIEKHWT